MPHHQRWYVACTNPLLKLRLETSVQRLYGNPRSNRAILDPRIIGSVLSISSSTTSASSGKVYTDIQTNADFLKNVFLQPDGQVLAIGTSYLSATRGLSMVRYWN